MNWTRILSALGIAAALICIGLLTGCAEPRPHRYASVLGYEMPPKCDPVTLAAIKKTLSVQKVSAEELRQQYLSDVRKGQWDSDPVEPQTPLWAISGYRGKEVVWTEIIEGLSPEMTSGILDIEACHSLGWHYKTQQAAK